MCFSGGFSEKAFSTAEELEWTCSFSKIFFECAEGAWEAVHSRRSEESQKPVWAVT
jgi:hypothetical protein